MNLGQLKLSLTRLPKDMDNCEVVISYALNGERQYDLLCAAGYLPMEENVVIALVSLTEIQRQVESGQLEKPAGYTPPSVVEGDEWKNDVG